MDRFRVFHDIAALIWLATNNPGLWCGRWRR